MLHLVEKINLKLIENDGKDVSLALFMRRQIKNLILTNFKVKYVLSSIKKLKLRFLYYSHLIYR